MKALLGWLFSSLSFLSLALGLNLESQSFKQGQMIPYDFSCQGKGITPALSWSNVPPGTKSLVLVVDDPDTPNVDFIHWIVYNIPPTTTHFTEGEQKFPQGVQFGRNSVGQADYFAICPPNGMHHYFFKLYALDTKLSLPLGIPAIALNKQMDGHIIQKASLMGRYQQESVAKLRLESWWRKTQSVI